MTYIILHEEGNCIREVVEFVRADHPDAIEIDIPTTMKIHRAIRLERELIETLRTGLSRRARGVKEK